MSDDHDDNIFDKDDALDFMIYEECERPDIARNSGDNNGKGGCLGMVLVLFVPAGALAILFHVLHVA